jgi:hypothetical protein
MLGGVPLSFFLLRRIRKIPNATAAVTAIPPIEPPTMAPIGVGLGIGVIVSVLNRRVRSIFLRNYT